MTRLGDVLRPAKDPVRVEDPAMATLISVRLHGKGAVQRAVGDGKAPKPFTGNRGRTGQFVFSRIWARRGAMALVPAELDGVVVTNEFPLFDVDSSKLEARYLNRYVQTSSFLADLERISAGASGQNRVKEAAFLSLDIPLPPLPEQRRIAAILDHADALRAKRRQVLAHLDSLTQSIFNDMFRSDGPTTDLGALMNFYSGGTPPKARQDYWTGDIPWFSPKDLKGYDLWDSQDHITRKVIQETNLRLLPPDTITIVVRGMILAHTIPVSTIRVPATINQDLKALIPKSSVNTDFLAAAIRARSNWILARVSTAAHGTKKLESPILSSIPVPDANPRQQRSFAARVATVTAQRDTIVRAVTADDTLFASLQSRAFRGEL